MNSRLCFLVNVYPKCVLVAKRCLGAHLVQAQWFLGNLSDMVGVLMLLLGLMSERGLSDMYLDKASVAYLEFSFFIKEMYVNDLHYLGRRFTLYQSYDGERVMRKLDHF